MSTAFDTFCRRKLREAAAARIAPLRTIDDRSARYQLDTIGNAWTAEHYDGPFHLSPAPDAGLPAVSLVFVQSAGGNTAADNPGDLGGGDTDKHLIYEGLSRAAAHGVLSGAATAGADVFFSIWHPELIRLCEQLGLPRHPAQIVVSRRGRIDVQRSLIFNVPEVPVYVLAAPMALEVVAEAVRSRPWVQLLPLEPHGFRGALARLRAEYGIERISAIGGRTTATALSDAGLVQDLYLTTTEREAGEPGTGWYAGTMPPSCEPIVVKRGTDPACPIRFEHDLIANP